METELERLVIRLVGDGSSYQQMMRQAEVQSRQTADVVRAQAVRVEQFGANLQGFAGGVLRAFSVIGIGVSLRSMFDAYSRMESGLIRLKSSIEASGRDAEAVTQQYKNFAKSIADVTTTSSGSVMALITRAEALGVQGEAAQRAAQNSVYLAAAMGGEAEAWSRAAIGMEQGNMHMIRRMLRLHNVKDETELLNRVNAVLERGFRAANAEADTASGQLRILGNTLSSLQKDFGGVISEAVKPFIVWLKDLAKTAKALDPEIKQLIVGVMALSAGILAFGPAVAIVKGLAAPLVLLGTQILALLNPLTLVRTAFAALWSITSLGPMGLGVTAAGGIVYALVKDAGGLAQLWRDVKAAASDAWDWTKRKAQEFIEWGRPVWRGMGELLSAVWDGVKEVAVIAFQTIKDTVEGVRDFVVDVWDALLGDSEVTWNDIRDAVRDALLFASMLVRNFGELVSGVWQATVGVVVGIARSAADAVVEWVEENRSLIVSSLQVAGGVLAAVAAFKVFMMTVGAVMVVLRFFYVEQLLMAAVWLVWRGTLLAVQASVWALGLAWTGLTMLGTALKAVLLGFTLVNSAVAVSNAAVGASSVVAGGFIAGLKLVYIALTASVSAASLAMGVFQVALLGVIGVAASAILLPIAVAAYSAFQAIKAVIGALSLIPTTSGPIRAVGNLFAEWGGILGKVWEALSVDTNLAWRLLKAGFKLAVEQIKALWPPLWDFIKEGFGALWEFATLKFRVAWGEAIAWLNETTATMMENAPGANLVPGLAGQVARMRAQATELRGVVEGLDRIAERRIEERLRNAIQAFRIASMAVEAPATHADAIPGIVRAREEVQRIMAEIEEARWWKEWQDMADALFPPEAPTAVANAGNVGRQIGAALNSGMKHELEKFDAALYGSAEALSRIASYRDRLAESYRSPSSHGSGAEDVGHLASGGPASAGRPYIVGERGPELFVPTVHGAVVPNHMLASGGCVYMAAGGYAKAVNELLMHGMPGFDLSSGRGGDGVRAALKKLSSEQRRIAEDTAREVGYYQTGGAVNAQVPYVRAMLEQAIADVRANGPTQWRIEHVRELTDTLNAAVAQQQAPANIYQAGPPPALTAAAQAANVYTREAPVPPVAPSTSATAPSAGAPSSFYRIGQYAAPMVGLPQLPMSYGGSYVTGTGYQSFGPGSVRRMVEGGVVYAQHGGDIASMGASLDQYAARVSGQTVAQVREQASAGLQQDTLWDAARIIGGQFLTGLGTTRQGLVQQMGQAYGPAGAAAYAQFYGTGQGVQRPTIPTFAPPPFVPSQAPSFSPGIYRTMAAMAGMGGRSPLEGVSADPRGLGAFNIPPPPQQMMPSGPQFIGAQVMGVRRYYDAGGFVPRGTDTIPAMLTPHEFVVNARDARRNREALEHANSGGMIQPVYRQEGGWSSPEYQQQVQTFESRDSKGETRTEVLLFEAVSYLKKLAEQKSLRVVEANF